MRATLHLHPVREFIIIGVTVVGEATMLDKKLSGEGRRCVAAVPSLGGTTDKSMDRVERLSNLIALGSLVEKVVLNPAPAVTYDIPTAVGNCLSGNGIPF
tara:strand:- start:1 stop:300 length:300 start_codon:yes stop_codon:yes gene_type:complete